MLRLHQSFHQEIPNLHSNVKADAVKGSAKGADVPVTTGAAKAILRKYGQKLPSLRHVCITVL